MRYIVTTLEADGKLHDVIEQDSTASGRMSLWLVRLIKARLTEGLRVSIVVEG